MTQAVCVIYPAGCCETHQGTLTSQGAVMSSKRTLHRSNEDGVFRRLHTPYRLHMPLIPATVIPALAGMTGGQ